MTDEPAAADRDGGLVRVRLDIGYDGTGFCGWARQPGRPTVAETIETVLCQVLRVDAARLTVAGRTDTGVHAAGQVAHVDLPEAAWQEAGTSLVRRLAGVLPPDVVVRAVRAVPDDFDARFSALARRYRYRIADTLEARDPLRRHDTLWWPRPLDVAAMHVAAQALAGEHDFAGFCKRREGAGTVRAIESIDVERADVVTVTVTADAFCHSMVRSLVGALIAVGEGRRDGPWLAGLLHRDARANDVTVAAAHGLTLVEVRYPPPAGYASRAAATRRRRAPLG